jgi:simple sugar transport system substrate-binding protein
VRTRLSATTVLLVALVVLAVAGCAASATATPGSAAASPAAASPAAASPAGKKYTIAYVAPNQSNQADVAIAKSWQTAAQQLGMNALIKDGASDPKIEADMWASLISQKVDAIAGGPNDSNAIVSSVDAANAAGIPVFMLGRTASGGKIVLTVTADNLALGTAGAQKIVDLLTTKYGQPKGLVLELQGELGSTNAKQRSDSFEAVMAKYPNIKVISKPTHWDQQAFYDLTRSVASANPDLDAIFCASDTVAAGVPTALDSLGKLKKVGEQGHIILMGVDGDPKTLQGIRDGIWDGTALQDLGGFGKILAPDMKASLDGTFQIKEGTISDPGQADNGSVVTKAPGDLGYLLLTPTRIIDKTNVDDPGLWGNMKF